MSNMTTPSRPSYNRVLRDLLARTRRLEATPVRGHYQIKVFADEGAGNGNLPPAVRIVTTGDGKFIFAIPDDLSLSYLWDCFCYVTTVGASVIRVQLRNITQAQDMLSTAMEIEAGDFTSYQATTQRVINVANSQVLKGDLIAIDVDQAGGGVAQGLGVGIELNPPAGS
jgi:hypothetical protein